MRRSLAIVSLLAVMCFATSTFAETVTVKYKGVQTTGVVKVYLDGQNMGSVYAAPMSLLIDGIFNTAFCVDLFHHIYAGVTYQAEVVPAPREENWCKMAWIMNNYIVTNNFTGSVKQVAIWKLTYPESSVWVNDAAVNQAANALVAQASGQCPLACTDAVSLTVDIQANMYGTLDVVATLIEAGDPVVGEAIWLNTDAGAFIDLPGGEGVTDENGQLIATLDLGGEGLPVSVQAEAAGQWIMKLVPISQPYQTLQTLSYGDPCYYTGGGSFDATPFGDPRTIGFWKHQVKTALGAKGKAQVDADLLASWLPLTVFNLEIDSLDALNHVLWLDGKAMRLRALQQCTATMLNRAYGQLDWYTDIDLDQDGATDGWFWEYFLAASDAYYAGDYETAKNYCDDINNL